MMAGNRILAKVLPRNSMATSETVVCAVTHLKRAWRHVQRNLQRKVMEERARKGKQVDVLDDQEKAGEDADKDFGELSNALWAVRVISDNVENDWIEVTRDRRSGRHRQVKSVQIRMSGPLS